MNLRLIPGRVVDLARHHAAASTDERRVESPARTRTVEVEPAVEILGRPLAAITDAERLTMIRCTGRRTSGDEDVSTWQVDFFAYGRRAALAQETIHVIGPFAENGLASLDAVLHGARLIRWGAWRMSLQGDFMEGGCCEDFADALKSP
jgi:hypothetical protein